MPFSTFLDGRNPSQLRGIRWLTLSDTGNVLTGVATGDTGGGVTVVWSAGTAIPCRIDPIGGVGNTEDRAVGGRMDDRSTHEVTVAAGVPVTTKERFAIAGRGTFEVTAVRRRTAEWSKTFEVVEAS